MRNVTILDGIDKLNAALKKIAKFDVSTVDLSERVLDNRIITLEGYLRFFESEAIPRIKSVLAELPDVQAEEVEGEDNDWSNLL